MQEIVGRRRVVPPDNNYEDFRGFLSHPIKISHTDWTPVTAYSIDLDLVALWRANFPTFMVDKTKNFLMFKGDLKVTVVVQGMPMAAGQMVLAFTPNVKAPHIGTKRARTTFGNYVNAKIVPHLVLDPSKTTTYELTLPVCTPNGWYSFLTDYDHGSYAMEFFPFNEMISGTDTAPSASICVYCSLMNPHFEGLTTTLLSNDFISEKATGSWSQFLSDVSATASNVAKTVPFLSPQLTLFSQVSGAVGTVLKWFGFSKPPAVDNGLFIMNRTCDNYSQQDGKSTSIVLGGSQTTSLALSPEYGLGTLDEMALSHICNIRGLIVLNGVIPVDLAKETAIQTIVLNPTEYVDVGVSTTFYWTPLAGTALMFNYWVGDFIVDFEFIASVFHRATVLIAWDPNSDPSGPITFSDSLTLLKNTTINISGNTNVSIRVPYKQPLPWSKVSDPNNITYEGHTNGKLVMFLVNPVTTNGSTDGIHYNVYFRSDNMRFAVPDMYKVSQHQIPTTLLSNDFVPAVVEFGPRTDLSQAHFRAFGDQPNSVKQLASRMGSLIKTLVDAPSGTDQRLFMAFENLPVPGGPSNVSTNVFSWIACAYLGYRGGVRWSVEFNNYGSGTFEVGNSKIANSALTNADIDPKFAWQTDDFFSYVTRQYAWSEPNLKIASRVDAVAPMLLPLDFAPTRYYVNDYINSIIMETTPKSWSGDPVATFELANGAADDATFTWFLGYMHSL